MADDLGTYSFLPWLRLGLANQITEADGDTTVLTRATIPVELSITGRAVGEGTDPESHVPRTSRSTVRATSSASTPGRS